MASSAAMRVATLLIFCIVLCQGSLQTYSLQNIKPRSTGLDGTLVSVATAALYGPDISPLSLSVNYETASRIHIKIGDPTNPRYEVPVSLLPRPQPSNTSVTDFEFSFTANPFGFAVTRASDGVMLFNCSSPSSDSFNGLIFEDQYIELSTQLDDQSTLFGLGEHFRPFVLNATAGTNLTLWAADQGSAAPDMNLYASHPFYLNLNAEGTACGVFLLNSNGMDVQIQSNSLTYRITGGILDLYIFSGPSPADVLTQYHEVIGYPMMPTYWSLGWHQCRYGYPNLQYVEEVVANYTDAGIPLETIWTDIDYMDEYMDWTFDPIRFPVKEVNAFVQQLHQNHQHYIVIVDPGIHVNDSYMSYNHLIESEAYIRNSSNLPFVGAVWPNSTIFPDFFHQYAQMYWEGEIADFLRQVPVDGLWIDMNEISNFCEGQEWANGSNCFLPDYSTSQPVMPVYPAGPFGTFNANHPPYSINNSNSNAPLWHKTLTMDSIHAGGLLEYNVHNLYGFAEMKATCSALELLKNERCTVISRSTFPGAGAYGGHWTGDNHSLWSDLQLSIGGVLNFQFFAIPFVGADICGFSMNTTEELCARWTELGAFYPFARNHNVKGAIPQEPYRWESVAGIAREVLATRYSLLPYYYSLFWNISASGGPGVWRPLWLEFPTDSNTHTLDSQVMIGAALLLSPVVQEGATSVWAYFPSAIFYDFYTGQQVSNKSQWLNLSAPPTYIPLHIRGGYSILTQSPALTTAQSRLNPYQLLIALDQTGHSYGTTMVDDGVSIVTNSWTYMIYETKLTAANTGSISFFGYFGYSTPQGIDQIQIYGITYAPKTFILNRQPLLDAQVQFNATTAVLTLTNIHLPSNYLWELDWS